MGWVVGGWVLGWLVGWLGGEGEAALEIGRRRPPVAQWRRTLFLSYSRPPRALEVDRAALQCERFPVQLHARTPIDRNSAGL